MGVFDIGFNPFQSKRLLPLFPPVFTTPNQWLCAWESQLWCVFVSPSSASRARSEETSYFKLLLNNQTSEKKSIICFSLCHLLQIDVTSCQGVLFSLCMVMLLCAITLSIVVPFGYVSLPTPFWKKSEITFYW